MKRDLNLLRNIMLKLEERPILQDNISSIFKNKTEEEYVQISDHIKLLEDLGYLELGSCLIGVIPAFDYCIVRITNDGYTFIENIRDKNIWEKIKPKILLSGNLALEFVKALAISVITSKI